MRRALVSLPDGVWKLIDNDLKGQIGDGDSEVIRNIVISYLTEKGYLLKSKVKEEDTVNIQRIADEIGIHDIMITALTEILEEHGLLKTDEWDRRIQKKLHEND